MGSFDPSLPNLGTIVTLILTKSFVVNGTKLKLPATKVAMGEKKAKQLFYAEALNASLITKYVIHIMALLHNWLGKHPKASKALISLDRNHACSVLETR